MANDNMNEIVIDDGSVRVPIKNRHGDEIGIFYFHPTDVGMVDRYNKLVADFNSITEPLEHISLNADGTASEASEMEAVAEAERRLFKACDALFGGNMSEAFFGKMHPFSPVNGRFYCEHALEAVGAYIAKQCDTEVQRMASRIQKYTAGYNK